MKKIFTLIAAAMMAVCASAASNHFIKVTSSSNKENAWDSQLFVSVKNVPKGAVSKVVISVKSTQQGLVIGTESIDDKQTEYLNQWNNSSVFNYTDEIKPTSDWDDYTVWFPGKTAADASPAELEYSATALLLNLGKLANGESVSFDNLRVYDTDGNLLYSEDFENATLKADDKNATAYNIGWQGGCTFEIDEVADHVVEDYMLKVTLDEVKADNYGSQVMINIPTLAVGKNYAIYLSVKTESGSTDQLGAVIEDNASTNRDEWGGSQDLQYSNNFSASEEWNQVGPLFYHEEGEGNWSAGTDGKYPYNRILLNLGKFAGTLYFDNIKIVEVGTEDIQTIDFKEGIINIAETRGWHTWVAAGKAESDCPTFDTPIITAIQNVESATANNVMYNIAGQRVQNAKGLVIKNGKKMIF